MAVHDISVKSLVSRIRQVFPDAPENYILNLVNDALVEMGMYNTKVVHAKISKVADQMYYDISDGAEDSSGNKLLEIGVHTDQTPVDPYIPDDGVLFSAGAFINLGSTDLATNISVFYDG